MEQKFTGGPFGITTKIANEAWKVTKGSEFVKVHEADNGSGSLLHREFCSECGSGLIEYGVGGLPWQRAELVSVQVWVNLRTDCLCRLRVEESLFTFSMYVLHSHLVGSR